MSEQYYANGRVAVLGGKVFGADKLARLVECNSLAECVKVLQENGIGQSVTLDTPNDYEVLLINQLDKSMQLLKELCFDANARNYFLCQYDYANAKLLMKCKYMRTSRLDLCFNNANYDASQMLDDFVQDNYQSYTKNMAQACYQIDSQFASGNRSGQVIDTLLDKAMFEDMRHYAHNSKTALVKDLFCYHVDTTNILLIFRTQKADYDFEQYSQLLLNGGKLDTATLHSLWQESVPVLLDDKYKQFYQLCKSDSTLVLAEKMQNSYKKSLLKEVDALSAQPVLDYYFNQVDTINKIRLVIVGVKNNLEKQKIKESISLV